MIAFWGSAQGFKLDPHCLKLPKQISLSSLCRSRFPVCLTRFERLPEHACVFLRGAAIARCNWRSFSRLRRRFELGGIDEIYLTVAHEQADQNIERLAWLQNAIACKRHCDIPSMEMPRSRRRSQDSCNAQETYSRRRRHKAVRSNVNQNS